jgi:hypothetical protein
MRSRFASIVGVLLALAPFLLAMGGGTPTSDTIPRPPEKYTADLLDRQGIATRVSYASCGGRTFLPLERGEGTLMVPFEKVARIRVGAEKGARVEATVQMQGGKALDGTLPRTLLCTGTTDYGNFQVEVRGLKEITFVKP